MLALELPAHLHAMDHHEVCRRYSYDTASGMIVPVDACAAALVPA